MVKVGIIIQARLNSSRLPGKILLPLPDNSTGTTLLDQVIKRALAVTPAPKVILATSRNPENDRLEATALKNKVLLYRGSEDDVLARFYEAATEHQLEVIIRLTADNPFLDPEILSQVLTDHLIALPDYTYTSGLPLGTNLEIISYPALKRAYEEADLPEHREHVTPFIRQHPALFNIRHTIINSFGDKSKNWRLTVDSENDYALASIIYTLLEPSGESFNLKEVAALFREHPSLLLINKDNYQKKVFTAVQEELTEAVKILRANNFSRAADLLHNHL